MTARFSLAKLVLTLVGATGFVVLSLWMIGRPDFSDTAKFFCVVGVAFFGAVALYAARSLFDRRPVLVIDARSVFDRRSMDVPIPWTEVRGIATVTLRNREFYYLDIGEPADRFTRGAIKRWLLNVNQNYGPGVTVSPHSLDVKPAEVREALARFAPVT
jgi:hypothetical protein